MACGVRIRLDVLTAKARIAGALFAASSWPLLCVRVAWVVLGRVAPATLAVQLAGGAALMIVLAFATLVTRPLDRLRSVSTWARTGAVVALALAAFVVLAEGAGAPWAVLVSPIALATFVAALAEEAVFRRYLPDRVAGVLRRAGARPIVTAIASVVIPQLSFALAHAENSSFRAANASELWSLFLVGVLYRGIARVGGLWAAAGVHAALNLTIALG